MGWPHHRHHGRRGHGHGHAGLLTAVDRLVAAVITILQAADHHQVVGAHGVTRDNWLRAVAGRTGSDAGDAAGGRGPGRHAAVTAWFHARGWCLGCGACHRGRDAAPDRRATRPRSDPPRSSRTTHRRPRAPDTAYTGGPPVRPHAAPSVLAPRLHGPLISSAASCGSGSQVDTPGRRAVQPPGSKSVGASSKPSNVNAGRDRAADEGLVTGRLRCLPPAGRHPQLWLLAGGQIDAEHRFVRRGRGVRCAPERQRCTSVEVPQLVGVDSMPVRPVPIAQEEVDGRTRAAGVGSGVVAPRLAEDAAFRMRRQVER